MMVHEPITGTLGGSGVTHIFAHHCTSCVRKTVLEAYAPGYQHVDQRALLLARPDDVVCVVGAVDPAYLEFLSSLGLGPQPDHLIELSVGGGKTDITLPCLLMRDSKALTRICDLLPTTNSIVLNPYYASAVELELATVLQRLVGKPIHVLGGNPGIVESANLKHFVHGKALELHIPVAPGDIVELPLDSDGNPVDPTILQQAIDRYLPYTGRVIVRATDQRTKLTRFVVGRDGEDLEEVLRHAERRPLSTVYLVQVMFDIVTTPNVQMFIEPAGGAISCVSVTEQCLDHDLAHKGNLSPAETVTLPEMLRSARTLAQWLESEGYTGLVGFDFVEYIHPETGTREHFLAEINARANEATYPSFLIEHLNAAQASRGQPSIQAFRSAKVSCKARSFAELREACGHHFFNPEIGRGVIPYNIGRVPYGRCDVAMLGASRQEVEALYEACSGSL